MNIFDFHNYKDYLKEALGTVGTQRGSRSRLAKVLSCQTGFVSQVLGAHTHFSLEHGVKINRFLQHSKDESHYFMLLLQEGRAGSVELAIYFKAQRLEILKHRSEIKYRIQVDSELTAEDSAAYYSHWYYAAIHILTHIPGFQTRRDIAEKLGLSLAVVDRVLEFLLGKGILVDTGTGFRSGKSRLHLGKESALISKHHCNWRLEAMKALEKEQQGNFHYSSVLAMSKEDGERVKALLLNALETVEPILGPSPEEELYSLCIDFFTVGQTTS